MMMRRLIGAAVLVLMTLPGYAASVLSVESVLSPAWVERANGQREPLSVGMDLNNKEKVHTGDGGRALLRMSEGSAFKLGASAMLVVDDQLHRPDTKTGGVVSATLDVVRGAFRFTTGLLAKPTGQRDVRVKVNAVTAGIRGTDVWGKAEGSRDIVCLLEGRITVTHGAAQFTMQEPNSFYVAPAVGPAQPPSAVSVAQVREWSEETEIQARSGAVRRGGTLSVTVAAANEEASATALQVRVRDSGFPADVARIGAGASARYEVRIGGLADAADANTLADRLRRMGFEQARSAR